MNSVVRLGVVGAGAIAQRGILPHLSQPDVQDRIILQAVCDPGVLARQLVHSVV